MLTSTLLSCVHGRDRRAERGICKVDLHLARRYGSREFSHKGRSKYTLGDLVFIASPEGNEITSWCTKNYKNKTAAAAPDVMRNMPTPLTPAPVDAAAYTEHARIGRGLRSRPSAARSHTVLVVDQSASMAACDVAVFLSRSDAVYGTLALDFIGKQIDTGVGTTADAVSLITMRDEATVEFEREPASNVLFNDLAGRMNKYGGTEGPKGNGNYLPALDAAGKLFAPDEGNGAITLVLMFLSDGRPSDKGKASSAAIVNAITLLAARFRANFVAYFIGFSGAIGEDFSILKAMANAASGVGAQGRFERAGVAANDLSLAVSSLVARLSETRTSITQLLEGLSMNRTERVVPREVALKTVEANGWYIYTGRRFGGRHVWTGSNDGRDGKWFKAPLLHKDAVGVAIRRKAFGSGAERIVYQCIEVDASMGKLGEWLVAKESKYITDEAIKLKFHEVFCETQQRSATIAEAFNARIASLLDGPIANVSFLSCSVYVVTEEGENGQEAGFLAEKMLTTDSYKKFNGNAGYVADAAREPLSLPLGGLLRGRPLLKPLFGIVEGDSEEETDGEDESVSEIPLRGLLTEPMDFVLAFSHFSYVHSNKKLLVCDLQGELIEGKSGTAPKFLLTDPVIHYASQHRTAVYGRTDRGRAGIDDFFATHNCNAVCKLMGLTAVGPGTGKGVVGGAATKPQRPPQKRTPGPSYRK